MKPEPLTKEKIIGIDDVDEEGKGIERIVVELENVKSAVDLVLKEIEKKKQEVLKLESIRGHEIDLAWLSWFEELIKKAFSGVLRE